MLATSPNENEAANAAMLAVNVMKSNNLEFADVKGNVAEKANAQLKSIDENYPKNKAIRFARAAARYISNNVIEIIEGEPSVSLDDSYFSEPTEKKTVKEHNANYSFDSRLFGQLKRYYKYGNAYFESINLGKFTISIQADSATYCEPRETFDSGNKYTQFEVRFWDNKIKKPINPLEDERFAHLPWAEKFRFEETLAPYMSRDRILEMIADLRRIGNQKEIDRSYDKLDVGVINTNE